MSARGFCPQFQTRIEEVPLGDGATLLPVRRCLLAERMVLRLRGVPAAAAVVQAVASRPELPVPVCIHGPDLDIIEHSRCTAVRCSDRCSPSYRRLLGQFQITDESEIDCGYAAQGETQK